MSVVLREAGQLVMYTKGAPEMVLGCCTAELHEGATRPLTGEQAPPLLWSATEMAARGLRVVALAYRDSPAGEGKRTSRTDLIFAGLAGDDRPAPRRGQGGRRPLRRSRHPAVMITGDHPETALVDSPGTGHCPAPTTAR